MATQYTQPPPSRYYDRYRVNRWQDWCILVLGIWFFFSPWILQFGWHGTGTEATAVPAVIANAAWNAWVLGVILFLVALSAIGRLEVWQEWFSIILGIWIFIAPWVLGFATAAPRAASWDHWIVGVLVFLCAVSALSLTRPSAPISAPPTAR